MSTQQHVLPPEMPRLAPIPALYAARAALSRAPRGAMRQLETLSGVGRSKILKWMRGWNISPRNEDRLIDIISYEVYRANFEVPSQNVKHQEQ